MAARIVRFGTFQADLEAGELYRSGIRLKLAGQPFQVLQYLLLHPGEVVSREQLRDAVWEADTFVDFDHGLNAAINKIREALGDSASNPRFIETVPRRGYRFIGTVLEETPTPLEAPAAPPPEPVVPPPLADVPAPQHSRQGMAIMAAAGVGLVLTAMGIFATRTRPAAAVEYRLSQVTRDSGLTWQPAISGDGNFVVYASDRATGKDLDIWIQHVTGGQPVRLTATPADESYPSISSDGRTVAFQAQEQMTGKGIFVIPALGGNPKLVAAAGQQPQISPSGRQVAYSTGDQFRRGEIQVVSSEGGAPRAVATKLELAQSPMWIENEQALLLWGCRTWPMTTSHCDYWTVPLEGRQAAETGAESQLGEGTSMGRLTVSAYPFPTAAAGSGGMVMAARSGDGHDLWWVPLTNGKAGGPARRITAGAGAAHPSLAATGRVAFSRLALNTGLWKLPLDPMSGTLRGTLQRVGKDNASMNYPNVSRDGSKLVYVSNRGGEPDIWIRDLATGGERQLTSSKTNEFRAMISPDGDRVAFSGPEHGFYTIPAAGGLETKVCSDCGANVVEWTPDGRKLLFYRGNPIRHTTVDLATGEKQDVAWHPTADTHNGRISPDGRWITFTLVAGENRVVYVAPLAAGGGGKPDVWQRISGEGAAVSSFWSPDGNLLYIHQGDTLWARKLHPQTKAPLGEAVAVQRFDGMRFSPIFSAKGLAGDGLYFLMMETTSNIWIADPVVK